MVGFFLTASLLFSFYVQHALAGTSLPETRVKRAAGAKCCAALQTRLGSKVLFPTDPQYIAEQTSVEDGLGYWTIQEAEVLPTCRVAATSAKDVSTAVKALVANSCQFAIRSGGHMSWAGSANIQDGVTIDLSALNEVSVQLQKKTVRVGPGARWAGVYGMLEPMNLTVTGGRVSSVGVGGLLTGGGNSFFAPRYGFGADNVLNYEVVLADGSIVNANSASRSDLYKSLKGGNNNFGIVTRFDMRLISSGNIWGGSAFYSVDALHEQIGYLQQFCSDLGNGVDDYAGIIWTYAFTATGPTAIVNIYSHTQPRDDAPIFANFRTLPPLLPPTTAYRSVSSIAEEIEASSAAGTRWQFATITLDNDADLMEQALLLANKMYLPVQTVTGFQVSIDFQPVTRATTGKSAATGGNSLGLDVSDGDLHWFHITARWALATDDAIMTSTTEGYLRQVKAMAIAAGKFNEYVYLNYALPSQDPISGYGAASKAALRAASAKYDPHGVFQKLVPGGFKLDKTATCC